MLYIIIIWAAFIIFLFVNKKEPSSGYFGDMDLNHAFRNVVAFIIALILTIIVQAVKK